MSFLFILPSYVGRTAGIDPFWVSGAGFARALGDRLGGVDVLTPDGLASLDGLALQAVQRDGILPVGPTLLRRSPRIVRTGLGDVRAWQRSRQLRQATKQASGPYRMVVQLHRRFQTCGLSKARQLGVPFVLKVEALEVREERSWGVRRPLWGGAVERLGELRIFRETDLIASISEAVDAELAQVGIEQAKRVVIPSAADLDTFSPGNASDDLRATHGLQGRFVVGWVGGFRPFHGLEILPSVARMLRDRVPGATLCLVGAGPLRDELAEKLRPFQDNVRLVGPVPHADVPSWLRTFDACLLLAAQGSFHYSPLKLYEYLGCGRPVIAVGVGEVADVLSHGRDALVVPPSDATAVAYAIERLSRDPSLRTRLGEEGRVTAERRGSWSARASTLVEALEDRGLIRREHITAS